MSNKGENNAAATTHGGVSAFDFFCIGFGAIVGVGWAVSINGWMANAGGPIPAAVGYIIALIMMVPVSLCYCELCPMLPVAGGGAAYAYRAFGEKIAFISGWAAFGGFVTIIPWEAIYVVDILSIIFPAIKGGSPLYTLANTDIYLGHIILGTVFSCILFAINWRGLSSSASFQRIMCLILIGAGLLAMVVSLIKYDAANFQPIYENVGKGSHGSFFMGALAILASAPFFLAGFETIPQGVEDAGGDITSVGKTVVLAVGLACIFYGALLFTIGSAVPDGWQNFSGVRGADGAFTLEPLYANPAASNLFRAIYSGGAGTTFYYIILIGALCGLMTTWNGFMGASPRLMMSMARSNMLPKWFAVENPQTGTPTNGLIACFVLSLMGPFLGMGLIDPLTSFSAAGFVTSWLITSACVVHLRKTEPNLPRPYKIPGGSAMAGFAALMMAIVFVLLFVPGNPVFMGGMAIKLFVGWMVIGFALFFAASGERNKLTPEQRHHNMFAKMEQ